MLLGFWNCWLSFERLERILLFGLDNLTRGDPNVLCWNAFAADTDINAVQVQRCLVEPEICDALLQSLFRADGASNPKTPECVGDIPPSDREHRNFVVGILLVTDD